VRDAIAYKLQARRWFSSQHRTILLEVHSPKAEAVREAIAPSHPNPTMCVERSLLTRTLADTL
jgi:hypothetical protein